jgi:uncharacterized OsmC-like protein
MKQEKAVAINQNGVNVEQMVATIMAITADPNMADFKFRLDNKWITCGHNRSVIKSFYGAGHVDTSRKEPFLLEADEPPVLLGTDKAPNPVEYLLHALAACVTTSLVYHAAVKGIKIEELESRVEGDIDLHGFLGLDENAPCGYKNIRIKFKIKADVPDEELEELCQLGPTFSPVFDTVTRPVQVEVGLDK